MNELQPCPNCKDSENTEIVEPIIDGFISEPLRRCNKCDFMCTYKDWNSFPRTRWIPVAERLPDPEEDSYHMVVQFGRHTGGWFVKRPGCKERNFSFGVTAWLDGLPPIPTQERD